MSSTSIAPTGSINPQQLFLRAPNYVNMNSVLASSANVLAVPAGGQYVRLAGNNGGFWVTWGNTGATTVATTNTGAGLAGAGSEFIQTDVYRSFGSTLGTTSFSVISTAANVISQSWWTA